MSATILDKLALASRGQAAAWLREHWLSAATLARFSSRTVKRRLMCFGLLEFVDQGHRKVFVRDPALAVARCQQRIAARGGRCRCVRPATNSADGPQHRPSRGSSTSRRASRKQLALRRLFLVGSRKVRRVDQQAARRDLQAAGRRRPRDSASTPELRTAAIRRAGSTIRKATLLMTASWPASRGSQRGGVLCVGARECELRGRCQCRGVAGDGGHVVAAAASASSTRRRPTLPVAPMMAIFMGADVSERWLKLRHVARCRLDGHR